MESNEKTCIPEGCADQALVSIKVQDYRSIELRLNIIFRSRWKDGFDILFKSQGFMYLEVAQMRYDFVLITYCEQREKKVELILYYSTGNQIYIGYNTWR